MTPVRTIAILAVLAATAAAADGDTRIAKWKDDKAAAIILMFDDSCVSHVKNVVPELGKRGLTGTFYINQGSGQYAANRQAWEKDIPAAGFELANHTLTHKGGATVADVTREITAANEAIRAATPAMKWPRLVSWGQPGGIKKEMWPISKDELAAVLKDNHLVTRPDFGGRGASIAFKKGADYVAHVDKAIKAGTMECIIYHGVGGDWLAAGMPEFIELADALVARKDAVWVTGHIPAHQYATERDSAKVAVGAKDAAKISLTLSTAADPAFYDQPLTLVTQVPAAWKACTVTQGKRSAEVAVDAGAVRYDALPGAEPIVITRK
ncbi:MAG: polysaccharide deacetylase family protein [Planctomycetes bacterium]|nr:polysaccharide deacetylase family protein [Planctomycetota bacterium]